MAGGVITAAWIQSVPVWLVAGAGIYGLSSWKRQRRGERLLKHAEKALGTGREAFTLALAIRGRLIQIPEEEASDPVRRRAFTRKMTGETADAAFKAWRSFQGHFLSARMFTPDRPGVPIPSEELHSCIVDLWVTYQLVCDLEDMGKDAPASIKVDLVEARSRFLGYTLDGRKDEIGVRLAGARAAMETELKAILFPQSAWQRTRHSLRGRFVVRAADGTD